MDIVRTLYQAGLICTEDFRMDFGGSKLLPECDSDLEEEANIIKCSVDY